ncbi:type II toxin-antitoxin system YafO family toxin [Muribacter muris]|uniref:type II toxin-antitoxin system YafO family toxin n=1 Tax=Muribacter muris TaxID=67855 RepID=UPI00069F2E37|nr:type II toxin-antitoxin system YafO family toxin [Muribacter muris]
MNIAHTRLFATHFDTESALFTFVNRFREWKANGEESSYYFGKDGFYSPIRSGLKHVHLVPIINLQAKNHWDRNWKIGSRRTSDTCLVYVEDNHDYLLISILPEPLAHAIAEQKEEKYRKTMAYFWQIAEQFFYYRNIIA